MVNMVWDWFTDSRTARILATVTQIVTWMTGLDKRLTGIETRLGAIEAALKLEGIPTFPVGTGKDPLPTDPAGEPKKK